MPSGREDASGTWTLTISLIDTPCNHLAGNWSDSRVVSTTDVWVARTAFWSVWSPEMDKLSIPTPLIIQEAAKAKGWTIKSLCAKAGISDETFFRWRDGKHNIGVDKLQLLLDALALPD